MSLLGRLVARRIVYAFLLGSALLLGTAIGGAAYETANPALDRIVWLEHQAGAAGGDVAIRRVLFADGRFLALTSAGYRAGIVDATTTAAIFDTARSGVHVWAPAYATRAVVGEQVELEFDGPHRAAISIANPAMNFSLPADLLRVMRLLTAADRSVASVPFSASGLHFWAVPVDVADTRDPFPIGFPLAAASKPEGVVVAGSDLAILRSSWTDLDERLEPGLAHRFVEADGRLWRISWQLDITSVGGLAPSGTKP